MGSGDDEDAKRGVRAYFEEGKEIGQEMSRRTSICVSVAVIGPLRQGDTAAVVDHFGVGIAHVEGTWLELSCTSAKMQVRHLQHAYQCSIVDDAVDQCKSITSNIAD